MYPYFAEMKKREKGNENHKASLRQRLRKTKEDYVGYGRNKPKDQFDFPKMTDKEFESFKIKLQKERKRQNLRIVLILVVLGIFGVLFMRYGYGILNYLFD